MAKVNLIKGWNLTLHVQGEDIVGEMASRGISLDPSPRATEWPVETTMEDIEGWALGVLCDAREACVKVLILGGMGAMVIAMDRMVRHDLIGGYLALVEIATRRERDANDRFVFRFAGLRVISPANCRYGDVEGADALDRAGLLSAFSRQIILDMAAGPQPSGSHRLNG